MSSQLGSILRRFALSFALFLPVISAVGCASSSSYTTRAYPTVPQPAADNQDYQTWAAYYSDQFQALGDKTVPPANNAPDSAKKAYADAKLAWDQHVSGSKQMEAQSHKAVNTMWYAIGGVAATILLLNFAL